MKIGIANDHGGYELKFQLINKLEEKGYEIINYGSDNNERVDYPVYAFKLCQGVISKNIDFGIAICKTGIGMSIACNKVKGIRCAKIDNEIDAEYSKRHNNANVIAISANKSLEEILNLIDIYISNEFEGGRHLDRLNMIKEYENEY
ncbi:MAG: RpiB/LacA/LacB family sugar-phosphate isomerase [Bacilli bacterium]|nr:RpiB/LacA/LacB family sugar-phosphate isomerase [Bacilli bacterium]